MERFAERIIPDLNAGAQQVFQGRGGFWQLVDLDKHFVNEKKPHRETFCTFISWILLKLHFEYKSLTKMDNDGLFSEIRALFSISKKGQGRPSPLPPNCLPVSVVEYASISLNIPKYP